MTPLLDPKIKLFSQRERSAPLYTGIVTLLLDPKIKLFPQRERSAPLYTRDPAKNAKEFGHRYGDNYHNKCTKSCISANVADSISSHGVIQMHP